jgi:hypothetical protein
MLMGREQHPCSSRVIGVIRGRPTSVCDIRDFGEPGAVLGKRKGPRVDLLEGPSSFGLSSHWLPSRLAGLTWKRGLRRIQLGATALGFAHRLAALDLAAARFFAALDLAAAGFFAALRLAAARFLAALLLAATGFLAALRFATAGRGLGFAGHLAAALRLAGRLAATGLTAAGLFAALRRWGTTSRLGCTAAGLAAATATAQQTSERAASRSK